ncbi:hypothetical protein [Glutamicibacter creatinolyticus]|uniref:hypothetical protein n=1 Tax=Glutamicibacter creatinolyticus TaxID=162496 RepID=UPI0037C10C7E
MRNIYQAEVNDSTLDDVIDENENRRRRLASLLILVTTALFILAALAHSFDRESTISQRTQTGYVELTYPSVARAGNEIELEIDIDDTEGLPETITVGLTEEYLSFFEGLDIYPDPESQTADGDGNIQLTLATEPGAKEFHLKLTGEASEDWEPATAGTLTVDTGKPEKVALDFKTWRIP